MVAGHLSSRAASAELATVFSCSWRDCMAGLHKAFLSPPLRRNPSVAAFGVLIEHLVKNTAGTNLGCTAIDI